MTKFLLIFILLIPSLSFAVEIESCQMLGDISAFTAQMRDSGMSYEAYAKFINSNFKNSKYKNLYLDNGKDIFVKNKKLSPAKIKNDVRTLCNYHTKGVFDEKEQ